ncbi:hypothetical protein Nans01_14860 [Nocardiopsis ansamitocini]|uniref:Uncharacterized protein n=1 Tax=Nocardiopsis ansamitocini TaxID=1670832 RepID=A0A9W6UIK2_9ACTN|nr:hypothetical protein Nans01_14860 [Nocardiopsis ansamitocini]
MFARYFSRRDDALLIAFGVRLHDDPRMSTQPGRDPFDKVGLLLVGVDVRQADGFVIRCAEGKWHKGVRFNAPMPAAHL